MGLGPAVHPLLGSRVPSALESHLFAAQISTKSLKYLADHKVQGSVVVPGAAWVEMGLAAADEVYGHGRHVVAGLSIQQPLFLADGVTRLVQTVVSAEIAGQRSFEIYSAPAESEGDVRWQLHATGKLLPGSADAPPEPRAIDLEEVRSRTIDVKDRAAFYAVMAARADLRPGVSGLRRPVPQRSRCHRAARSARSDCGRGRPLSPASGDPRRGVSGDGRHCTARSRRFVQSLYLYSGECRARGDHRRPGRGGLHLRHPHLGRRSAQPRGRRERCPAARCRRAGRRRGQGVSRASRRPGGRPPHEGHQRVALPGALATRPVCRDVEQWERRQGGWGIASAASTPQQSATHAPSTRDASANRWLVACAGRRTRWPSTRRAAARPGRACGAGAADERHD